VRPRLLRRCAALLGLLFWLVLSANPASAHAVLVSSQPASGATLAAAPRVVQLRFSEDIAPRFASARLVDRDGRTVSGGLVVTRRDDARLLTLELPALPNAAYGVLWQVLAETDGHTTSGVVVFNVGGGSKPLTIADDTEEAVARPADVARRWLGVCLLAGLIGTLAVAGFVLGQAGSAHPAGPLAVAIRTARRRLLTLAAACATLAAVVGVGDVVAEAARQAPGAGGSWAAAVQLLAATRWGQLWLVQEAALLALALLALRGRPSAFGTPHRRHDRLLVAGAGALVLAVVTVEAMGSHAAALDSARGAAVAAGAVHILSACLWLGALPALALMLWPPRWGGAGPADLLVATRGSLTRLAAASVGLVVVTGLYSAGREVETVDALLTTPYGRTLLVKSVLLLVLAALGLVNSARLHGRSPRWLGPLGSRVAARWPSRRLVVIEAGVGALLLVAVGVLLETVPARGPATAAAPAAPATTETASGSVADLVVTVSVTPNRPGMNGFTVLAASSRRPPPAPVEGVELKLVRGGDGSAVALQQVAPGRWFGTGRLDQAGRLRLTTVVRRAGKRLATPLSWWVSSPVPPQQQAGPAPGRRLAPYVDGIALSLLAGALALAAWRLLVVRRRQRPVDVVHPAPPERVLEGMR
jgi:copper transport protein